ncbi:MAG: VOC family protein [Phycisphaerae bacterium]
MGNAIVHFEIGCKDKDNTKKFYASLFDWQIAPHGEAEMINTGSPEGICGHITALGHEPHQYVTVYAQVDDLEAYLAKAAELGGKTIVEPVEVPEAGHFAWLSDPEGNVIGLWKPIAPSS